MIVDDPGHQYRVDMFATDGHRIDSGQSIQFRKDPRFNEGEPYHGTNCQELLRVLIDRIQYLDTQVPCDENISTLTYLREALWRLELRALRRKKGNVNQTQKQHDDLGINNPPFHAHNVETYPTGDDGHIRIEDAK